MFLLLFRGLSAPFTARRGGKDPKQRREAVNFGAGCTFE
jgi:hypothetical protein